MASLIRSSDGDEVRYWLGDMGNRLFCCPGGHALPGGAVQCGYGGQPLRLYSSRGDDLPLESAVAVAQFAGMGVASSGNKQEGGVKTQAGGREWAPVGSRQLAPVLNVGSVREQFAHVARQRCRCGSPFLVTAECVEEDPATRDPIHVLIARCLNSDCASEADFRFAAAGLLAKGLGRVIAEGTDPCEPGRMFAGLSLADEAAIRILVVGMSALATGLGRQEQRDLSANMLDAMRCPLDEAAFEVAQEAVAAAGQAMRRLASLLKARCTKKTEEAGSG